MGKIITSNRYTAKVTNLLTVFVLLLAGAERLNAQFVANAGLDTTICYGSSITIGGSPTAAGGTGPYTYHWSPATGLNSSVTANPVASPITTTTYTVTITDFTSATATASVVVTIDPVVNADAGSDITICANGGIGLNCNVTGGSPGYTYQWTPSSILVNPNSSTPVISVLGTTTDFTVVVTDAYGCSASDVVRVNALPLPVINAGSNQTVCQSGQVTLGGSPSVSGGTAPYQYFWSPATGLDDHNAANPVATVTGTTTYSLIAVDANNCSVSPVDVTVFVDSVQVDSLISTNVTCNGNLDGAISIAVVGGTAPYLYSLNGGPQQSGNTFNGLGTGGYSMIVIDANNCSATGSAVISQPTQLRDSIVINPSPCMGVFTGARVYPYGGTAPYAYQWMNGQTLDSTSLGVGFYSIYISDAHGCVTTDSGVTTAPQVLSLLVEAPDSNAIPDSVSITVNGGQSPYTASWGDGTSSPGFTGTVSHFYQPGIHSVQVWDGNGCSIQTIIDAGCHDSCVWPGDANYDGMVDNNDLLSVGQGYGAVGYQRLTPTINWLPQYCQNWPDTVPGGVNDKHVDCNGDGVINADDTTAILLNYSHTHPRSGGQRPWRNGIPALSVKLLPDTLSDGDLATAYLSLGDSANIASNIYGLAFIFHYDPIAVDSSTVAMEVPYSWLCSSSDHINIAKQFPIQGQVQAAITRIDHATRTGDGNIATVTMRITTGNINGKLDYYSLRCYISDLVAVDNHGRVIDLNEGTDSTAVSYVPTAIKQVQNNDAGIYVFPNPATDQLTIDSKLRGEGQLEITDLLGQLVMKINFVNLQRNTIDIKSLNPGTYLLQIQSGASVYRVKFVKLH
ncbi:MAG TPA: T9SS type A sorting domain-containing protein [Chitinophagales bacterium]|nr:T9SS type A sorting domain-containing protein [Chitinophagales bacterium]